MKDTARKTSCRQEAPAQLAFEAMLDARATLHDAIVSAGLGVLGAMLEEERTRLCGPRYAHAPDRAASRGGHVDGELALGGRRVRVRRPRVRGSDGREVALETWERFAAAVAVPLMKFLLESSVMNVSLCLTLLFFSEQFNVFGPFLQWSGIAPLHQLANLRDDVRIRQRRNVAGIHVI